MASPHFLAQLLSSDVEIGRDHLALLAHVQALRAANAASKLSVAVDDKAYESAFWSEDDELDVVENSDELWLIHHMDGEKVNSKEWRPDIKFDESKCGPRDVRPGLSKAEIFSLLLPEDEIKLMVVFTNNYATQVQRSGWVDTHVSEMKAFLGALLYMGRKKLQRPDAWRIDPWGDVFLKSVFRERRFTDLLACFHMVALNPNNLFNYNYPNNTN